jgi:hypothetical protein
MPGYAGSGQATLLLQNQQIALLQQAAGIAGTASIAVQLERSRYAAPTGVSLQFYFTNANGSPASPGTFEIDIQTSDLDEDIQYVTANAFTGPLNAGFAGRVDLSSFYAKYVRVFVTTLASAVFANVYITSFASAGAGGSGGGGGGGPALEVGGVPTADQALLNLVAGSGIAITDEGGGAVQIASTGGTQEVGSSIPIPFGTPYTVKALTITNIPPLTFLRVIANIVTSGNASDTLCLKVNGSTTASYLWSQSVGGGVAGGTQVNTSVSTSVAEIQIGALTGNNGAIPLALDMLIAQNGDLYNYTWAGVTGTWSSVTNFIPITASFGGTINLAQIGAGYINSLSLFLLSGSVLSFYAGAKMTILGYL